MTLTEVCAARAKAEAWRAKLEAGHGTHHWQAIALAVLAWRDASNAVAEGHDNAEAMVARAKDLTLDCAALGERVPEGLC